MGFAGFVTSGVTPAVAGALRGRNMGRQQAEEQRRYDTEQARLASQTKWTQQQALEQAQRQAMLDALAQEAQAAAMKDRGEGNALQRIGLQQRAADADMDRKDAGLARKNALEIARIGAQSREQVAGIAADSKVASAASGGASPGQETDLAELDASLLDIQRARAEVQSNPDAFSLGKQALSNVPFFNGLGRNVVDRMNPEGVMPRGAVGVVQSTIRRLQSGTAVTKSEKEVLESFLPDPRADSEEVITEKLTGLERWIANKRTSLEGRSGAAMPAEAGQSPGRGSARERAAQLRSEGYGREEAMTILRQEGYRVE